MANRLKLQLSSESKIEVCRIGSLLLWLLILLRNCTESVLLLGELRLLLLLLARHKCIEWVLASSHLWLVRVHTHAHSCVHLHASHSAHTHIVVHLHSLTHHRLEPTSHGLEPTSSCGASLLLLATAHH